MQRHGRNHDPRFQAGGLYQRLDEKRQFLALRHDRAGLFLLLRRQVAFRQKRAVQKQVGERGARLVRDIGDQRLYRRLGFAELKYLAEIFTVRYAVLAWSAGGAPDETAAQEAHAALYRGELPGPLFRRFIHIPAPPEDNERDIL